MAKKPLLLDFETFNDMPLPKPRAKYVVQYRRLGRKRWQRCNFPIYRTKYLAELQAEIMTRRFAPTSYRVIEVRWANRTANASPVPRVRANPVRASSRAGNAPRVPGAVLRRVASRLPVALDWPRLLRPSV